ncbi:hypothetical protein EVAR_78971_1 [Eumeta japonica]|uniref:Uncharacterized protein n=1 Tax=Eumeta variegata TaxID=151549 RepID=A0A4C1UTB8_EUMVA|nr:hypothetical protein EVAR_78971_1 [Eumeta japonica]
MFENKSTPRKPVPAAVVAPRRRPCSKSIEAAKQNSPLATVYPQSSAIADFAAITCGYGGCARATRTGIRRTENGVSALRLPAACDPRDLYRLVGYRRGVEGSARAGGTARASYSRARRAGSVRAGADAGRKLL